MNKMIEGNFEERNGESDEVLSQLMQAIIDWIVLNDGATRRELFLALVTAGLMTLPDEDQMYACIGMNEAYLQRFFTEAQLEEMQPMLDVEGEHN